MTATTADQHHPPRPGEVVQEIIGSAVRLAVSSLSRTVDDLTDRLDGAGGGPGPVPEVPGPTANAAAQAAGAGLVGKNPVWAAVKGAWSAGGVAVKAAVVGAVVALVLLLVLAPVLLLLLAIALLVVVAVAKVKQRQV